MRAKGVSPDFPFATELDETALAIAKGLMKLKAQQKSPLALIGSLIRGSSAKPRPELLKRLGLDQRKDLKGKLMRALVAGTSRFGAILRRGFVAWNQGQAGTRGIRAESPSRPGFHTVASKLRARRAAHWNQVAALICRCAGGRPQALRRALTCFSKARSVPELMSSQPACTVSGAGGMVRSTALPSTEPQ